MNYVSAEKLDELLHQVFKPARYIGEELNIVRKEHSNDIRPTPGFPLEKAYFLTSLTAFSTASVPLLQRYVCLRFPGVISASFSTV